VRLAADSHALIWFAQGSSRLSPGATEALREAEAGERIIVSIAVLIDLWYVTQTTHAIGAQGLADVRELLIEAPSVQLCAIDTPVAEAFMSIDRQVLGDPWDRFIVATAVVAGVPLVTRDDAIRRCGLVETIW
jgi:PIN domain nuclease of toxin-antitoxin system